MPASRLGQASFSHYTIRGQGRIVKGAEFSAYGSDPLLSADSAHRVAGIF
jgi:hypothetical protein